MIEMVASLEILDFFTFAGGVAWGIADFFGHTGIGGTPGLMQDGLCFTFFGCNSGFFGYDAFVHLLFGIAFTLLLVWLGHKFPILALDKGRRWHNALTLLALIVFFGFCWEIMEFCGDLVSVFVLHLHVLHPNNLSQPTNADTMGDMSFNTLGALTTILALLATNVL